MLNYEQNPHSSRVSVLPPNRAYPPRSRKPDRGKIQRSVSLSKMMNFLVQPTPKPAPPPMRRCMSPPNPVSHQQEYNTMNHSSNIRDPALISQFERLTEQIDDSKLDDEHRLIARYAAKIAQETLNSLSGRNAVAASQSNISTLENNKSQRQREILADLHQKNRDIMREIARLKEERDETSRMSFVHSNQPGLRNNPSLVMELRSLRQRKEELEHRMASLQESRRELMIQLESLMKMLRSNQAPGPSPQQSGMYHPSQQPASKLINNGTLDRHSGGIPSSSQGYSPNSSSSSGHYLPQQMMGGQHMTSSRPSPPSTGTNLHQELLIAADNTTHAAVNLLTKLSLGDDMCPPMNYQQQSTAEQHGNGKISDHIYSTVTHAAPSNDMYQLQSHQQQQQQQQQPSMVAAPVGGGGGGGGGGPNSFYP